MQIYEKFNKDDETIRKTLELNMLEFSDYDDFIAKFGMGANPEIFSQLYYQMMYYEGLGLLVKRGLIDIRMVEDFMSGVIISFWGKYGPVFLEYREKRKHPTWAEWTEYLYNQIEPIYRKQHGAEAIYRYKTGKYEIN